MRLLRGEEPRLSATPQESARWRKVASGVRALQLLWEMPGTQLEANTVSFNAGIFGMCPLILRYCNRP